MDQKQLSFKAYYCDASEKYLIVHPYTRSPIHPYTHIPVHLNTRIPVHPYTYTPIHRMIINVYGNKVDQENNSKILINPHSLY
jgi:hypothetical protein